jgi:hypothetical protein
MSANASFPAERPEKEMCQVISMNFLSVRNEANSTNMFQL